MAKTNEIEQTPAMPPMTMPSMPGAGDDSNPDGEAFAAGMSAMMGGTSAASAAFFANVDLSKVVESSFVTLVNGEFYDFYIKKAKFDKTGTQKDCIKFVLEVTEAYPEAGGLVSDQVTLGASTMWKFKAILRATDMLSEDSATPLCQGEQDFVDCMIRAKIKNELWNGQMRSKIDGGWFVPESGPQRRQQDGSAPSASDLPVLGAPGIPNFGG